MDTAGSFRPSTVLLWRKMQRHAEAQRILGMFPEARVEIVDRQRLVSPPEHNGRMGEMLDSLALDHVTLLTERLVPFFSHLPHGCLMLLTKSSNVDGLLRCIPNSRVVVSWSLNTQRMIETYEIGTASLEERIHAAKRCQEHGYRLRLRIDPGILYDGWQSDYADLIRRSLGVLHPENVTLGMLRLLPRHFGLAGQAYGSRAGHLRAAGLSEKASDGKLRYPSPRRLEFYRFLIDVVRSFNEPMSLSLCRETQDVWSELNHFCDPRHCNCLEWWRSGCRFPPGEPGLSASILFNALKAVLAGEASLRERFEPLLELLLALQQGGDIVLEEVELALEVYPTAEDQRREHHQLQQDRQVDPAVEPPVDCVLSCHGCLL